MSTNFFMFEVWSEFSNEEYRDIQLAAIINPTDTPAEQLTSARLHRMLAKLTSQKSVEIHCLQECLDAFVSEGVLTSLRVSEVIDALTTA
jgi:hypothetical protein